MLSKKTQYALQALSYLVEKDSDEPILIAEIAEAKYPFKIFRKHFIRAS